MAQNSTRKKEKGVSTFFPWAMEHQAKNQKESKSSHTITMALDDKNRPGKRNLDRPEGFIKKKGKCCKRLHVPSKETYAVILHRETSTVKLPPRDRMELHQNGLTCKTGERERKLVVIWRGKQRQCGTGGPPQGTLQRIRSRE